MPNYLTIIDRIIAEHVRLAQRLTTVDQSVNDTEAALALGQASSGWTMATVTELPQKLDLMQKALASLETGVNRHFAFEEAAVPPLFGDVLTKWLLMEHGNLRTQVVEVRNTISGDRLTGASHDRLLAWKSDVDQAVSRYREALESHASEEEVVLRMMRKPLLKEAGPAGPTGPTGPVSQLP